MENQAEFKSAILLPQPRRNHTGTLQATVTDVWGSCAYLPVSLTGFLLSIAQGLPFSRIAEGHRIPMQTFLPVRNWLPSEYIQGARTVWSKT